MGAGDVRGVSERSISAIQRQGKMLRGVTGLGIILSYTQVKKIVAIKIFSCERHFLPA